MARNNIAYVCMHACFASCTCMCVYYGEYTCHCAYTVHLFHHFSGYVSLHRARRAMERSMFGISVRDHNRQEEIKNRTGVKDMIAENYQAKLPWAIHTASVLWQSAETYICRRYARELKWGHRRHPIRRPGDLRKIFGTTWRKMARARMNGRKHIMKLGEATRDQTA